MNKYDVDCEDVTKTANKEIWDLERQVAELETALRQAKMMLDDRQQQEPQDQHSSPPQQVDSNLPTIFMITPTYTRWTQKADLVRLCQTLMHVRNLHWIVVEDAEQKTELVTNFLKRCQVTSTHLNVRTPPDLRLSEKEPKWRKSRGVEQRNLGLQWLREKGKDTGNGVVYFGDDDNTYDLEIFNEVCVYTHVHAVFACIRQ